MRAVRDFLPVVLAFVLFVLLWEASVRFGAVNPLFTSSPTRIIAAARTLTDDGGIFLDAAVTLGVCLLSVGLAFSGGLGLGIGMAYHPAVYQLLNPAVVSLNAIPKIALMPLVVLWFGMGLWPKVVMGTLMAIFPVMTAAYAGTKSMERDFILLARSFRASWFMTLKTVILPSLVPYLLSGLRVGINYALVGVLVVEFFAADRGLGYRMTLYLANFKTDYFFVPLLMIAAFALACAAAIAGLESRWGRWRASALE